MKTMPTKARTTYNMGFAMNNREAFTKEITFIIGNATLNRMRDILYRIEPIAVCV